MHFFVLSLLFLKQHNKQSHIGLFNFCCTLKLVVLISQKHCTCVFLSRFWVSVDQHFEFLMLAQCCVILLHYLCVPSVCLPSLFLYSQFSLVSVRCSSNKAVCFEFTSASECCILGPISLSARTQPWHFWV